jgi:hypothetical protein
MLGNKYLTGETVAQGITFPGQAHFAIPGAKKVCRDCWFWSPRRAGDKKAVCGKAASMTPGQRPMAVPRYATICQYFRQDAPTADDP